MKETYWIGHLEVNEPWGNSGGVVRTLEEAEWMAKTGVGWVELGPYTTTDLDNPEEINESLELLKSHNKPVIIGVIAGENPIEELPELAAKSYELNPNAVLLNMVGQKRKSILDSELVMGSLDYFEVEEILEQTKPIAEKFKPFQVRIAAQNSLNMTAMLRFIAISEVVDVIQLPGFYTPEELETKNIEEDSYEQIKTARNKLTRRIHVQGTSKIGFVSCAGIKDGEELYSRMKNQKACGGSGSEIFRESDDWEANVAKLLEEFYAAKAADV